MNHHTLHYHVRLPLFQGEYNRTVVRRATPSVSRGAYLILAIVRCARCRSTCNSYARLSTLSFDMQFLCALLCSGARCHSTCIHSDVHATIRYAYYATLSSMLYSFLFKGSRLVTVGSGPNRCRCLFFVRPPRLALAERLRPSRLLRV